MKRSHLALAAVLFCTLVLLVVLWANEGPLWQWLMTRTVYDNGILNGHEYRGWYTTKRWTHPPVKHGNHTTYFSENGLKASQIKWDNGVPLQKTTWNIDGSVKKQERPLKSRRRVVFRGVLTEAQAAMMRGVELREYPPWWWGVTAQREPTSPWWDPGGKKVLYESQEATFEDALMKKIQPKPREANSDRAPYVVLRTRPKELRFLNDQVTTMAEVLHRLGSPDETTVDGDLVYRVIWSGVAYMLAPEDYRHRFRFDPRNENKIILTFDGKGILVQHSLRTARF